MAGPRHKGQCSLFLLIKKRKKTIEKLGNSRPIEEHNLHFNMSIKKYSTCFSEEHFVSHIKQHIHYCVKGKHALYKKGPKSSLS